MPNKFTVSQIFAREEKTNNVVLEIKEVWKLISSLGDHVLQFIGLYPLSITFKVSFNNLKDIYACQKC